MSEQKEITRRRSRKRKQQVGPRSMDGTREAQDKVLSLRSYSVKEDLHGVTKRALGASDRFRTDRFRIAPDSTTAQWLQNLQQTFLLPSEHATRHWHRQNTATSCKPFDRVKGMAALEDAGWSIKSPNHAIALQEFAECCFFAQTADITLSLAKARNYAQQNYPPELRQHTTNLMASVAYMTSADATCSASVWSNVVIVSYEITNEVWHQMLLSDGVCMIWVWLSADKARDFFRSIAPLQDHAIVQNYHHSACLPLLYMGLFCCVSVEFRAVCGLSATRNVIVVHDFKPANSLSFFNTSAAWNTARSPITLNAWMREWHPVSTADNVKAAWDTAEERWVSVDGVANFAGGYENELVAFDIRHGPIDCSKIPLAAMSSRMVGQNLLCGWTTPVSGENTAEVRKLPEQWSININSWSELTAGSCDQLTYTAAFKGLVCLDSVPTVFADIDRCLLLEVTDGIDRTRLLLEYETVNERIEAFRSKMTAIVKERLDALTNSYAACLGVWKIISSADYGKFPIMFLNASCTPSPSCASCMLDAMLFPRASWVKNITFAGNMTLFMGKQSGATDLGKAGDPYEKLVAFSPDFLHFASSWGSYIFLRLCFHTMLSRLEWSKLQRQQLTSVRKGARDGLNLTMMPSDAIRKIADYLLYDTWRCLGLTCKAFYRSLFIPESVREVVEQVPESNFVELYHHTCIKRLVKDMLNDDECVTASVATYDVWNGHLPIVEQARSAALHNIFTFHVLPDYGASARSGISIPAWTHAKDLGHMLAYYMTPEPGLGDHHAQALDFENEDLHASSSDGIDDEHELAAEDEDNDLDLETTVYMSPPSTPAEGAVPLPAECVAQELPPSLSSVTNSTLSSDPLYANILQDAKKNAEQSIQLYNEAVEKGVGQDAQRLCVQSYLSVMSAWSKWVHLEAGLAQNTLCKFDINAMLHQALCDMRPLTVFTTRVFAEVVMASLTRTVKNAFQWHDFESGLHCYRDRALYDLVRDLGNGMQNLCVGFNLKRFEELPAGNRLDFEYRQLNFDASTWFGESWQETIANIDTIGDVFRLWHAPLTPRTADDELRRHRDVRDSWRLRVQVVDVRCGHSMYAKVVRTPGEKWNFEDTRIAYYCNQEDPGGSFFADPRESVVMTLRDGDMDIIVNIGVQEVIDALGHVQELADLHINDGADARRREALVACKLVGAVVDIAVMIPSPMIFVVDQTTPRHLRNLCSMGSEQNKVVMSFAMQAFDLQVMHAGWRNHDQYHIPTHLFHETPEDMFGGVLWSSSTHGNYPQRAHTMEVVLKTGRRYDHAFHPGHLTFPHLKTVKRF